MNGGPQRGAITDAYRVGREAAGRLIAGRKLKVGDELPDIDYMELDQRWGMTDTLEAAYRDGFNGALTSNFGE